MFVMDDLMEECSSNKSVAEAFTRKRHHHNLSVVLVLQNLFSRGSVMRDIHLNAQYVVLFQNPRDKSQFSHFARQVDPENAKDLIKTYRIVTREPFSHLFIDLKPHTPDNIRYRSDSLSSSQIVYVFN
jgi:hypothetical protein